MSNGYDLFDKSMRNVLKNEKYDVLTGRASGVNNDFFDGIIEWLYELFGGEVSEVGFLPAINSIFTESNQLLIYGGVIVIVVVIVVVTSIIATRRKKRKKQISNLFNNTAGLPMTSSDYFTFSNKKEQDGNLNEAVRYAFLGVLLILNEKNIIYIHEVKTTGQIARELMLYDKLYNQFLFLLTVFNACWFGKKTISAAQYSEWKIMWQAAISSIEKEEHVHEKKQAVAAY